MTWTDIYLICFIVGFSLSVISALSGIFHLHLPGMHHGHGAHIGSHAGHGAHAGHGGHGSYAQGGGHGPVDLTHISVFNFGTIAAFLTWFGGVGYLLSRYSGLLFWVAFSLSTVGGIVGAAIVFLFLTRVLLAHERPLNALDYEMIGVYGQLTSAIREGGTGEISFSQEGVRRGAPARSEDGTAIQKNTDVVVTRYESGVAYVRRWDDLTDTKETR
jgi:membrane protein implicated in regulation of membrane protease activity